MLVDQGRRRLVLCRGGVEGIMGGSGIGIGAMERVMRMNGSGVASKCSPTLGSGCTLEVRAAVSWELGDQCEGLSAGEQIICAGQF